MPSKVRRRLKTRTCLFTPRDESGKMLVEATVRITRPAAISTLDYHNVADWLEVVAQGIRQRGTEPIYMLVLPRGDVLMTCPPALHPSMYQTLANWLDFVARRLRKQSANPKRGSMPSQQSRDWEIDDAWVLLQGSGLNPDEYFRESDFQ